MNNSNDLDFNLAIKVKRRGDDFFKYIIPIYFLVGMLLATVHGTWIVGIGVGGICTLMCLISAYLLPKSNFYQYVISASLAIFMAQFIYQMQGLFEMHFFVFIGSILLVVYQNYKLQIPLVLIVVIHHATFAYLQYAGNTEIYFTQLSYMDLSTFTIHVSLAAVIFILNGYWSYIFSKDTSLTENTNHTLNKTLKNTQKNIAFAKNISAGKLDEEIDIHNDDELGKALKEMQQNLRISFEREFKEKFITTGIAEIGDILRNEKEDLKGLSDEILRKLVKYTTSNQGGIYLLNESGNESYLTLTACYAYNRKKYIDSKFEPGEGLIGQVFIEKERAYLNEIPEDYITISSGLGEARPSNVVIIPLKTNEAVVGILELASFDEYKNHQLEFLDKVSENIASTISTAKVNENTKRLLQDSQEKAQQLKIQEEEMRQSFKELQSTQEEMQRKKQELQSRMTAIDQSGIASIEFDIDGKILNANKHFLKLFGYTLNEIKGKMHKIFIDPEYGSSEEYTAFWDSLKKGEKISGEFERVGKTGKRVFIRGAYSPMKARNGKIIKFLKLVFDISDTKRLLTASQKHIEDIEKQEKEFRQHFVQLQEQYFEVETLKKELEHKVNQLEISNEELTQKLAKQEG